MVYVPLQTHKPFFFLQYINSSPDGVLNIGRVASNIAKVVGVFQIVPYFRLIWIQRIRVGIPSEVDDNLFF
jgi:hypothetical protein